MLILLCLKPVRIEVNLTGGISTSVFNSKMEFILIRQIILHTSFEVERYEFPVIATLEPSDLNKVK